MSPSLKQKVQWRVADLDAFIRMVLRYSAKTDIAVYDLVTWLHYRQQTNSDIEMQSHDYIEASRHNPDLSSDDIAGETMADMRIAREDCFVDDPDDYWETVYEFGAINDPDFDVPLIQRTDIYKEMADAIDKQFKAKGRASRSPKKGTRRTRVTVRKPRARD